MQGELMSPVQNKCKMKQSLRHMNLAIVDANIAIAKMQLSTIQI